MKGPFMIQHAINRIRTREKKYQNHIITRGDIDRIRKALAVAVGYKKEDFNERDFKTIAFKDHVHIDLGLDSLMLFADVPDQLENEFDELPSTFGLDTYIVESHDYSVKNVIKFACERIREARIEKADEAYKIVRAYREERGISA